MKRWQWKDVTIAVLAVMVVGMSVFAAKDTPLAKRIFTPRPKGDEVAVYDVVLDRQGRSFIDVLFDRPVAEGLAGLVPEKPPANLSPATGGSWQWRDASILRFEASDRLTQATDYTIELLPESFLPAGKVMTGERVFKLRTDQFQVESVNLVEEPAFGPGVPKASVVLHGEIRFNYEVDPKQLATHLRLTDPPAQVPIDVSLETTYSNNVISFRSAPVQKQKQERNLDLVIVQSLTSNEGNVPLLADFHQAIPIGSSEKLAVRAVTAEPGENESTLRIQLTSPVSAEVAAKYLSLDPAAKFRLATDRNVLLLTGALAPGKGYRLAIGKGMPALDDAVLQEDFAQTVNLPSLTPSIAFQSDGMFLSASGYQTVAVDTINVDQIELAIDRVYRNNLFALLTYERYRLDEASYYYSDSINHALGDRIVDVQVPVAGIANQRVTTPLTLKKWVAGKEPGFYRVLVSRPGEGRPEQRWLLLTDLGIVAKQGEDELLVWVSSFADLSPAAGARVRLMSDQNQLLAEGRTDLSGLWHLSGLNALEEKGQPFLITVEQGSDWSFLTFDRAGVDTTGLDVGGATPSARGYTAFLYGERDIYRPGETVTGVAVARTRDLKAPPPMPVLLRHLDPEGRTRGTVRLDLDRRGMAEFRLPMPAYEVTGNHTLELLVGQEVIGQYRFQVEEFVPDRIKVEIQPGKELVGPGEQIAYDVHSAYLFGPPAAGLPVESRVRLEGSAFAPKGFEPFVFENDERSFSPVELASLQGTLDAQGVQSFEAKVPAGLQPPSALTAVVTARVQEQGGRGVSALTRVRVDPYPYYLGLKRIGDTYPDPGKEVRFEWVAVGADGKPAKAGALRAELFQDRWNTVLRRVSGGYRYDSVRQTDLIATQNVEGGAEGGAFTFVAPRYGSYRAMLTDPQGGASTQIDFYASGWGYSPWAIKNPGRLELDLDKDEYRPGDTAIVQVRAPFSGKLLLTVEREGILASEIHDLSGNTAKISLPIRADFRPNSYVTATLIRSAKDLGPGEVGRAFGAVPLSVDRLSNRLAVAIQAPEEIRPRTRLAVTVTAPPGAAVTLAAVDEGILQLIAQKTPDPFSFFYQKLALGVSSYDIFALLFPEVKPGGKGPAGGGEGAEGLAQYVRTEGIRRVEPVAFWSGVLTAGADGKAHATFDVPELQGALRLMAVAVQDDRFGSAERATRVRDPLVLLPTLPRFLAFGDRFQVPVSVRNDTGRDGSFVVELATEGPVTVEGEARQTVAVANGAEKLLYFAATAGEKLGDLSFRLTASGNGETTLATGQLPLGPDLPPETRVTAGSLADATTSFPATQDAEGLRPDTVRRTLRLGPVPLVRFSGKLSYLLHYPYGCLEQTVSSVFPLLYLADLAKELEPKLFEKGEPASLVETGIRRVSIMQLYNGGFSLWPGGSESDPWATVYATHFLVEASRAGHVVEASLYDGALSYLAGDVKAKQSYSTDELERTVYSLYVLARAGKADLGTMDFLRERQVKNLRVAERGLLAAAYAAVGNRDAVADLSAGIADVETVESQTGHNFDSTTRNRALLLLALLDAVPGDARIPALADRLARDADIGRWWNTQETAFTFLALGQLYHQQAEKGPYSGAVFVGGKKLRTFGRETLTLSGLPPDQAIEVRMDAPYQSRAVYYSLETRGVPTPAAFQAVSEGIELERTYLTRDGSSANLQAVRQGDLLVIKTRVRSVSGVLQNVVVENLLPAGLEVENPRLTTTETLPFVADANLSPGFLDLRDDRILVFADLPDKEWETYYTLVRAVTPGSFHLPPAAAEAMYSPALRAAGEPGMLIVGTR